MPAAARRDSLARRRRTADSVEDRTPPANGIDAWWRARKRQRLRELDNVSEEACGQIMRDAFVAKIGNMMLVMMPSFALLVRLLYWRRPIFYLEHLVFALHTHAFALLVFAVNALVPGDHAGVAFLVLAAYLFVALRRVYGGTRWRTLLRTSALLLSYGVVLLIGISATALIAFAFG